MFLDVSSGGRKAWWPVLIPAYQGAPCPLKAVFVSGGSLRLTTFAARQLVHSPNGCRLWPTPETSRVNLHAFDVRRCRWRDWSRSASTGPYRWLRLARRCTGHRFLQATPERSACQLLGGFKAPMQKATSVGGFTREFQILQAPIQRKMPLIFVPGLSVRLCCYPNYHGFECAHAPVEKYFSTLFSSRAWRPKIPK